MSDAELLFCRSIIHGVPVWFIAHDIEAVVDTTDDAIDLAQHLRLPPTEAPRSIQMAGQTVRLGDQLDMIELLEQHQVAVPPMLYGWAQELGVLGLVLHDGELGLVFDGAILAAIIPPSTEAPQ